MKKRVLVLFSVACTVLFSGNSFGQIDYFANNPVWTETSQCADMNCTLCTHIVNYNYYIGGDTTINSIIYKKLLKRGQLSSYGGCMYFYCNDTGSYSNVLEIMVRQVNRSIYVVPAHDTASYLLYNFNLKIGDTLPQTYNHYAVDTAIVTKIDSMRVGNNYRKIFKIQCKYTPMDTAIFEGIGCETGFIENMEMTEFCEYRLNCFGINDTAYYPAKGTTCYLPLGIQNIKSVSNSMTVFPNPCTTSFTIKSSELKSSQIQLFNVIGQSVLNPITMSGQQVSIDVSTLPKGIYVVQMTDVLDGRVGREKVVVQ